MFRSRLKSFCIVSLLLAVCGCTAPESGQPVLEAEKPLHLEEHLDAAVIEGSEIPDENPAAVEWRFDEPQPAWKPLVPVDPKLEPVALERLSDGLRVTLTSEKHFPVEGSPHGGIYVPLPDWQRRDWSYVLVRARTTDDFWGLGLGFNLSREPGRRYPFINWGEDVSVIKDGSVQTYRLRVDRIYEEFVGPSWRELVLRLGAEDVTAPASIDILSVTVIPKEAMYEKPVGVQTESRGLASRRTLYTHAPANLRFRVKVPDEGRLDFGIGVVREDAPVTFRVAVEDPGQAARVLFEQAFDDPSRWSQHSVDLSAFAGKEIGLTLANDAERTGSVALWTAPTLSGETVAKRPNVIFYVMDGAAADSTSVYGYPRRTTPNLERLAAEGAVFENAYSNSSFTKLSTPSFMTSLHSSVLGGFDSDSDPLPEQVVTLAERMHGERYQTAVFASNPYCGTLTSLDRGVDVLRDAELELNSISSKELHEDFWSWREAYPAEPYWVHFQTTDVHRPFEPVAPFAGLFIDAERRRVYRDWVDRIRSSVGTTAFHHLGEEVPGVDLQEYLQARRDEHDEAWVHNDHQIGRLVDRLKASGSWENTIFILGSDHGNWGSGYPDPVSPTVGSRGPLLHPSMTRIPLIVVWPGRIAPGQRFSQPVSMIDVAPTILDLAGLPAPEIAQGQSLAPLLLGAGNWDQRPVLLDEFFIDPLNDGRLSGLIEIVDGRWGASLEIGNGNDARNRLFYGNSLPAGLRQAPLMLCDLWEDPRCLRSLHDERPELVEKYTRLLQQRWKENWELAQQFSRPEQTTLTSEQLETLRALGYLE